MDDMVDTAGTLCKAAGAQGQRRQAVLAYCTHPVLSGPASSASTSSDARRTGGHRHHSAVATTRRPAAHPPVVGGRMLAETIRRISNEDSVSSLFIE
jgi:ribose-phosphate pyrophosphokinase